MLLFQNHVSNVSDYFSEFIDHLFDILTCAVWRFIICIAYNVLSNTQLQLYILSILVERQMKFLIMGCHSCSIEFFVFFRQNRNIKVQPHTHIIFEIHVLDIHMCLIYTFWIYLSTIWDDIGKMFTGKYFSFWFR